MSRILDSKGSLIRAPGAALGGKLSARAENLRQVGRFPQQPGPQGLRGRHQPGERRSAIRPSNFQSKGGAGGLSPTCAKSMAGRRSPQSLSISQLTSQPETIPSCDRDRAAPNSNTSLAAPVEKIGGSQALLLRLIFQRRGETLGRLQTLSRFLWDVLGPVGTAIINFALGAGLIEAIRWLLG